MPFASASTATVVIGRTTKSSRKPMPPMKMAIRAQCGSRSAGRSRLISLMMLSEALLQDIDQDQEGEGGNKRRDGDDRGAAIVEFLQLDDDQQRHDLGEAGTVAGDEDHPAVF